MSSPHMSYTEERKSIDEDEQLLSSSPSLQKDDNFIDQSLMSSSISSHRDSIKADTTMSPYQQFVQSESKFSISGFGDSSDDANMMMDPDISSSDKYFHLYSYDSTHIPNLSIQQQYPQFQRQQQPFLQQPPDYNNRNTNFNAVPLFSIAKIPHNRPTTAQFNQQNQFQEHSTPLQQHIYAYTTPDIITQPQPHPALKLIDFVDDVDKKTSEASAKITAAADEVEEVIKQTTNQVGAKFTAAVDEVEETFKQTKEQLSHIIDETTDNISQTVDNIAHTVTSNIPTAISPPTIAKTAEFVSGTRPQVITAPYQPELILPKRSVPPLSYKITRDNHYYDFYNDFTHIPTLRTYNYSLLDANRPLNRMTQPQDLWLTHTDSSVLYFPYTGNYQGSGFATLPPPQNLPFFTNTDTSVIPLDLTFSAYHTDYYNNSLIDSQKQQKLTALEVPPLYEYQQPQFLQQQPQRLKQEQSQQYHTKSFLQEFFTLPTVVLLAPHNLWITETDPILYLPRYDRDVFEPILNAAQEVTNYLRLKPTTKTTSAVGPSPTSAAGPPPTSAAGPPPTSAAGPPPTSTAGPPSRASTPSTMSSSSFAPYLAPISNASDFTLFHNNYLTQHAQYTQQQGVLLSQLQQIEKYFSTRPELAKERDDAISLVNEQWAELFDQMDRHSQKYFAYQPLQQRQPFPEYSHNFSYNNAISLTHPAASHSDPHQNNIAPTAISSTETTSARNYATRPINDYFPARNDMKNTYLIQNKAYIDAQLQKEQEQFEKKRNTRLLSLTSLYDKLLQQHAAYHQSSSQPQKKRLQPNRIFIALKHLNKDITDLENDIQHIVEQQYEPSLALSNQIARLNDYLEMGTTKKFLGPLHGSARELQKTRAFIEQRWGNNSFGQEFLRYERDNNVILQHGEKYPASASSSLTPPLTIPNVLVDYTTPFYYYKHYVRGSSVPSWFGNRYAHINKDYTISLSRIDSQYPNNKTKQGFNTRLLYDHRVIPKNNEFNLDNNGHVLTGDGYIDNGTMAFSSTTPIPDNHKRTSLLKRFAYKLNWFLAPQDRLTLLPNDPARTTICFNDLFVKGALPTMMNLVQRTFNDNNNTYVRNNPNNVNQREYDLTVNQLIYDGIITDNSIDYHARPFWPYNKKRINNIGSNQSLFTTDKGYHQNQMNYELSLTHPQNIYSYHYQDPNNIVSSSLLYNTTANLNPQDVRNIVSNGAAVKNPFNALQQQQQQQDEQCNDNEQEPSRYQSFVDAQKNENMYEKYQHKYSISSTTPETKQGRISSMYMYQKHINDKNEVNTSEKPQQSYDVVFLKSKHNRLLYELSELSRGNCNFETPHLVEPIYEFSLTTDSERFNQYSDDYTNYYYPLLVEKSNKFAQYQQQQLLEQQQQPPQTQFYQQQPQLQENISPNTILYIHDTPSFNPTASQRTHTQVKRSPYSSKSHITTTITTTTPQLSKSHQPLSLYYSDNSLLKKKKTRVVNAPPLNANTSTPTTNQNRTSLHYVLPPALLNNDIIQPF